MDSVYLKGHGRIDLSLVVRMRYTLLQLLHDNYLFLLLRNICSILKKICMSREEYYFFHKGDSERKILFVFFDNLKTCRPDCNEMFINVSKVLKDDDYDIIYYEEKRKFDLNRTLSFISLLANWIHTLVCMKVRIILATEILKEAIDCFDARKKLDAMLSYDDIKLAVFFYDANSKDNYFSQYFQKKGIKTATLQHGIQLAPRKEVINNVDFSGIEFGSFVSDYYLAWNEFTKQEAIKAGINENRIIVLGVAKCIGRQPIVSDTKCPIVGLLLDGIFEDENNLPMINMLNKFCVRHNLKLKLRYHPNYRGNEYDEAVENSIRIHTKKGESLTDFIKSVGFCVLANSTVLFELEFFGSPFIRYSSGNIKDKYRDYQCLTFQDEIGIESCYKTLAESFDSSLKKSICVDDNYRVFFEKFIR